MGTKPESSGKFEEVYLKYSKWVYQTALIYSHNPEDVQDIVQEVFARYYMHSLCDTVEASSSWLGTTARNLAINQSKRAAHERLLSEGENMDVLLAAGPDVADTFFENLWKRDMFNYANKVLDAVCRKNKRWYDALIYAYCMEMPRKDIADCMGITLSALESLLQRAKKWVKENYRDEYDRIMKA